MHSIVLFATILLLGHLVNRQRSFQTLELEAVRSREGNVTGEMVKEQIPVSTSTPVSKENEA